MNKIRNIILIGAQGCGKSTQADIIANYLKIPYLSIGRILRAAVKKETALGKKIAPIINKGKMIPDEIAINIIKEELAEDKYSKGYILDGFPRDIKQAQAIKDFLEIDKVFNIKISDKVSIERISGRRICPNKHVWHLKFKPSQIENKCDICQEELYQRKDDSKEALKTRLSFYREHTSKLLDYYKQQDKLVVFDGEKGIEEISQDLLNYLKKNVR